MSNPVWTQAEKAYLLTNGDKTVRELAAELTRIAGRPVTPAAVREMRRRLGVGK